VICYVCIGMRSMSYPVMIPSGRTDFVSCNALSISWVLFLQIFVIELI
jgi:hypothetical protein